jgi:hypothetical protein
MLFGMRPTDVIKQEASVSRKEENRHIHSILDNTYIKNIYFHDRKK